MEQTEIQSNKAKKGLIAVIAVLIVLAIAASAIIISYNRPSKRVERKLAQAERYLIEFKYDEAIALYNEVLEIEPNNIKARVGLVDAYIATGNEENASTALAQAEPSLPAETITELEGRLLAKFPHPEPEPEPGLEPEKVKKSDKQVEEEVKDDGYEREYDENGNVIVETRLKPDGSVQYSSEFEYDADGNRIKESRYNAKGEPAFVTEFNSAGIRIQVTMYDRSGKVASLTSYDDEGNLYSKTTYKEMNAYRTEYFDAEGKVERAEELFYSDGGGYSINEYRGAWDCVKVSIYDSRGRLDHWCTNEFDENGLCYRNNFYDANNNMIFYIINTFDDNGKLISEKQYNPDGTPYTIY